MNVFIAKIEYSNVTCGNAVKILTTLGELLGDVSHFRTKFHLRINLLDSVTQFIEKLEYPFIPSLSVHQ